MRWGVKDVEGQRSAFVIRAASGKERISELCREFQISRPTAYLWLKRYRAGGDSLASVQEKSRRPKLSPRRTPDTIEEQVIQIRQREGWGAKAIHRVLERDRGIRLGRMTVHRILERHGLIRDEDRHAPALKRFEHPNQLWQMDFKGQFRMSDKRCTHCRSWMITVGIFSRAPGAGRTQCRSSFPSAGGMFYPAWCSRRDVNGSLHTVVEHSFCRFFQNPKQTDCDTNAIPTGKATALARYAAPNSIPVKN
jgi:transposase